MKWAAILIAFAWVAANGQNPASNSRAQANLVNATTDERIRAYERSLKSAPDDIQLQSELVAEYLQKLRESADSAYLKRATDVVDRMLEKDGGSLAALRFQNEIDLQLHDFRAVADRATSMSRYAASDPGVWANLGDASMELGDYNKAKDAYLRMFALRPNLASYNRLAYWAFVTGNAQQAIAFMRDAINSGDSQPENVAWCWAELGDMYYKSGQLDEAAAAYRSAIALFPSLHRAIAGLGKVSAAKGQVEEAIITLEQAQSIVPLVEYVSTLEDLYSAAGKPEGVRKEQQLMEVIAKLGAARQERTNRNLALALADHNRDLDVALTLVRTEIPTRGDVYTWDALAWVLFKNGLIEEAQAASAHALKLGTPEPLFYYHASKIAAACGNSEAARTFSKSLLALNGKFDIAKRDFVQ